MTTPSLPAAVSGERFELDTAAGRLSAYVAGEGPPLLLVHSVNAAASAAEVKPLHERYRAKRTVYSPDLPGFGFSDRSARNYTPRLMTDAVLAMARHILDRHGPTPIDALALSLSAEFLARAAVEWPEAFRTLALVSPTGFRARKVLRAGHGTTLAMPWLYRALRGPGWGPAIFRGLTRPGVIRYFLEHTWGSKAIDEDLWAYDVVTTRQPGAENAPLCFVSGQLFSADIHDVYEAVRQPVWMTHGVRGDFTDYGAKSIVAGRPNWKIDVFDTGALIPFEQPDGFVAGWDAFLGAPAGASVGAR